MNDHINLLPKAKSSWIYPIYVPSYSRAGSAPFLESLKEASAGVQRKTHIIIRPEEHEAYQAAYPWATIVHEATPGIGPARMRALIDADERGYKNIVVLDDDITRVSLLQRITTDAGKLHTRRYSASVSGQPKTPLLLRSLGVGCALAGAVFRQQPTVAYGAARNALFSGEVDPSHGAYIRRASFPACVMFFDVERFTMREMPEPYQYHGEDLAMFLDTMEKGQHSFTLPGVAYDQQSTIETTIPLDPLDEVGRPHLQTTETYYPSIHPYLRVSMRNKLGGVMRIGVNWKRWYKDTGNEPLVIPLTDLIEE